MIPVFDPDIVNANIMSCKKWFANDLKARIEAVIAFGRSQQFSKEDVFQLIDETLNATIPTEDQIREAEKGELP